MEMAGFARRAIPGEFSVLAVNAHRTTDILTASTTPTTFIGPTTFYVGSPSESINILFTGTFAITDDGSSGGNTPPFILYVDGVFMAATRKTAPTPFASTVELSHSVTGLAPGYHVAHVTWNSTFNTNSIECDVASDPTHNHVNLVIRRTMVYSDREMDGFAWAGWPSMYTQGPVFQQLVTSSTTDTNSTPVTLLGSANITTRHPASALLIRFNAVGTCNAGQSTANSPKFLVRVDGVDQVGTGGSGRGAGFRFNANSMCVVAVAAGVHLVQVYWGGGGSSGSTINPALAVATAPVGTERANLLIEEVFCPDVGNLLTDKEGFAVTSYSALNVPQVRYGVQTTDVRGTTTGPTGTVMQTLTIQVDAEQSLFVVETTTAATVDARVAIFVDNVAVAYSQTEQPDVGGTSCVFSLPISWVGTLAPGTHVIKTELFDAPLAGNQVEPATHPTYSHHTLLVREYASTGP